ncbi:hypothetical protein J6590_008651 [Homalodisca vitripennis]|nr:hypothetical protein J6590_008651 [Homalodisca vitripennis]
MIIDSCCRHTGHRWMFWKRRRHLVTFLAFLGFFNVYTLRVNLSVAIVAMNSPYNVTLNNGTVVECARLSQSLRRRGAAGGRTHVKGAGRSLT